MKLNKCQTLILEHLEEMLQETKQEIKELLKNKINNVSTQEIKMFRLAKDIGNIKRDEYISEVTKVELHTFYENMISIIGKSEFEVDGISVTKLLKEVSNL